MQELPIDARLPELCQALAERGAVVLTAPPGTGKSTRVPPALLAASLLAGEAQVVCLQPRRVAAIGLARRIAVERGWQLGAEVGYRIRFDSVGGAQTRLWIETEGTLTRQLLRDPYLERVGAVILDEFHERSWHADLLLAWISALRASVRPDLKLIVMSATMQTQRLAQFLHDCPVLTLGERLHPISKRFVPAQDRERLPEHLARVVRQALQEQAGDVLAFLPGVGEIQATSHLLQDIQAEVLPLHGSLPAAVQAAVLEECAHRRVILATNVAETSITVPGVRVVIDSGLSRVARFDPGSGFDRLELEPISTFSAEQRAGRAGRTGPGHYYQLVSRLEAQRRREHLEPELQRIDLAPALLSVLQLHGRDLEAFPWFEPPEAERLQQAATLLRDLGFIDDDMQLTGLGRLLAPLPMHPRLGRLLLEAARHGVLRFGAEVAALLAERDLRPLRVRFEPQAAADLLDRHRLLERCRAESFKRAPPVCDLAAARQVDRAAKQFLQAAQRELPQVAPPADPQVFLPLLLIAAFPDRIGKRQAPDSNRVTLVGGQGVRIDEQSCAFVPAGQRGEELLVAHDLQGLRGRGGARVILRQAVACRREDLLTVWGEDCLRRDEQLSFDTVSGKVSASRRLRYRDLTLAYEAAIEVESEQISACLSAALAPQAEELLRRDARIASLLDRLRFIQRHELDAELVPPDLAEVLHQASHGCRSRDEVLRQPLYDFFVAGLGHAALQRLERLAPERLEMPSGSHLRLDYSDPARPALRVRMQELFGSTETPAVGAGRVRVLLHLLAPSGRPAQITGDLAGFWRGSYAQVRKDLRARYPKHDWPEDPATAAAARGPRRRA